MPAAMPAATRTRATSAEPRQRRRGAVAPAPAGPTTAPRCAAAARRRCRGRPARRRARRRRRRRTPAPASRSCPAASLDQQLLDLAAERGHLRHARDARRARGEARRPETGAAAAATAARTDRRARPSCAPATARPARTGTPSPCSTPRARRRSATVAGRPARARRDARRRSPRARRRRRRPAPNTTSRYAMPDIDEPRTAVAPGVPSSARVSGAVDRVGDLGAPNAPSIRRRRTICGIGELGDGVARQRAPRGLAGAGRGEQRRGEHEAGMAARPGDDARDHGAPTAGVALSASTERRGDVRRPGRTCPSPRCARRRAGRDTIDVKP